MKYNKNRIIRINNNNNIVHPKYNLNENNFRNCSQNEQINNIENNPDNNFIAKDNEIYRERLNNPHSRIHYIISKNDNKIKIINYKGKQNYIPINPNNYKKMKIRNNQDILRENQKYKKNRNVIINDYSPNYSQFDNISKNNKQNIPQLDSQKYKFLQRFNTEIKKNENINTERKPYYSSSKNKLVICTRKNNFVNNNDNEEEKLKTEYSSTDKNNDFHNYLRMSSYFSNSHSKNKKNNNDNVYGNQTERLRNKILFEEKQNNNPNNLITKGRIKRFHNIKNTNYNQVGDNYYYNNTVNNFYTQRNSDYNGDLIYEDYYYSNNKQRKKNKKSDLFSFIIDNKNENVERISNDNIIKPLKITSFELDLESTNNKKVNENKDKDGIFIIKRENGKLISEIEINNNKMKINEINDIIDKYNIACNYLKQMKENIIKYKKQNEELLNENDILKKKINNIEEKTKTKREENGKKEINNIHENKEEIKELREENNSKQKYKRRSINDYKKNFK